MACLVREDVILARKETSDAAAIASAAARRRQRFDSDSETSSQNDIDDRDGKGSIQGIITRLAKISIDSTPRRVPSLCMCSV